MRATPPKLQNFAWSYATLSGKPDSNDNSLEFNDLAVGPETTCRASQVRSKVARDNLST